MTNSTTRTIAITGANGFLGRELVRHFSRQGWQVLALVRDPSRLKADKHVRAVAYDLTKPVGAETLKGVTHLVHAAYVKQEAGMANVLDINIDGAKQLLKAARQAGVTRTVFMSSMSAHDQATSTYGLQKLAIEKLFDQPGDISLRSGLIIGNGGLVKQMADFMKSKHAVPLIGGGRQPLQTIGAYDLARVIEAALTVPKLPNILTVATPQIYPYKEFYRLLGRRLGIKFVYIPVPYFAIAAVLKTVALLHLPLSVNEDNLIGLKNLRSAETKPDLAKLSIELDDLSTALAKTTFS